jgi:glucosylceramidase
MDDIIPMIKDAQKASQDGFHIIASPWTAPPWMKDNNDWKAGKLLPAYYPSWANYFVKYLEAYKEQGIDIWGITVENEPLGNGGQWESMHFTPEEMATFIENHLGPLLAEKAPELKVLVYDQNRDEMEEWAEVLLENPEVAQYVYGTAVHWYSHTADWLPEALNATHEIAPDKAILHTEACIDAEVPHWQEDEWYWKKEATDWGWDWAPEDKKKDHPKYVPVYRYARDIIGCMNSWVEGWVDWNMVLDRKGGPNWANNWCNAPVIVDPEANEVYYTPLYYVMSHFSKYIRPGATRIGIEQEDESLMVTAAQNPDGTIAVVVLNMDDSNRALSLELNEKRTHLTVASKAIQTIIIK